MVILPPIGMVVTEVKPNVMVLLLDENLPGILSSALVKAKSTPPVITLPSAGTSAKRGRSPEVLIVILEASVVVAPSSP